MDGLELLQNMRPELEILDSHRRFRSNDPDVRAAVRRLLDQEQSGVVDDEREEFYDDLRIVTLALFKVRYELQRQAKLN